MTEEKTEIEATPPKRKRFFIVEYLFAGGQHIAHPDASLGGVRDIALGPYEAKVIPYDEWEKSPFLDQVRDEGRVKTYWSNKRPVPLPVLPPEAPMKASQKNAIWSIAFGEGIVQTELGSGNVMEESVAEMLINLIPEETTSYQGPGRAKVLTSTYLKKEHYETLYWAKWLIENFPRAKPKLKKRIPMIEKRMAEIEAMP